MSSPTRIVRAMNTEGPAQTNVSTFVFGAPQPSASPRESYLRLHRILRSACLEETRPGAFLFAAQANGGAVGTLTLRRGSQTLPLTVDAPMLERGMLLGRQERCEVIIPDRLVSRVHAVALKIDGVPHLIDAGSSNGTWHRNGARVRCSRLEDGDVFGLGDSTVEWRERRER